ncbi:MAG: hypothetical protein IKA79_00950, partial [Lentisphaeria bacterium]|nr:hypothetical protein [Lentisphaeria bacterium]
FIRQLLRFLEDYHFDAFHGCDGFGHPRYALCDGDFSEEMLTKFSAYIGKELPELPHPQMAEYILSTYRKQWSLFYASEHAAFWKKTSEALKKKGFFCILNTCWTRDPFEALFRYGIDYRLLAECGIDGFFAEASSAVLELEGWNDTESSCIEKCQSMLLLLKGTLPETKIRLLGCIKDGMEQYNALRHAPCRMRTEAYTLYNLFCNGRRCADGILECLGDGITSGEWHMIDTIRLLAADGEVFHLPCAHVFLDEKSFDNEFHFYASCAGKDRTSSSFTLLHTLIHSGAVLPSVITFREMKKRKNSGEFFSPPLLILHPAFLSEEAKSFLAEYPGLVAFFGLMENGKSIARIRRKDELLFEEEIQWRNSEKTGEEPSWLWKLQEKDIADSSLCRHFVEKLNQESSFVLPEKEKEFLRVWSVRCGKNKYRIFARSEKGFYLDSVIRLKGSVCSCTALTEEPSRPVRIVEDGKNTSLLYARIPPYGTIILSCETR